MVRILVLTVVALTVAAGVLLPRIARPVLACSAGPDYNPVADSDVIVAGLILAWERGDTVAVPPAPASFPFTPVRLTLGVEQRFKGTTPPQVVIVDRSSLLERVDGTFWAGGGGACGSFDDEPTGRYVVMGLTRNADGTYSPNRVRTFYVGAPPPASGYEWGLLRIASFAPAAVMATRFGTPALACPVANDVCAFGLQLERWLAHGEYDAIVTLLQTHEVVCPGPVPIELGGPYPLCDGSPPGERRYGTDIIRPHSEGGVGSAETFREMLAQSAAGLRLVSIGCPDAPPAVTSCGDRFSLVFVGPACAASACQPERAVVFLVGRQPSGQLRLGTILSTFGSVLPAQALAGGPVDQDVDRLFLPGPGTGPTFIPWSAPTVSALPAVGTGLVVDTEPTTVRPPLLFGVVLSAAGLWAWSRRRRDSTGRDDAPW